MCTNKKLESTVLSLPEDIIKGGLQREREALEELAERYCQ
jgi:hypothetical protein